MTKEQQKLNPTTAASPATLVQNDKSEEEIDLVEVFYLLWGHIVQIIACFLVGAVLAFGFTFFFVTPKYQASSSIYVVSASNNSIVNLTDLQIGSQLTADYQELMLSRPLLQDVIKNLDLDVTYRQLEKQISISNTSSTRILTVTVTDTDPQRAADIANELSSRLASICPRSWRPKHPIWWRMPWCPPRNTAPATQRTRLWALCWVPCSAAASCWCST